MLANNMKNGQGTLYGPTIKYVGMFVDDKYHGEGALITPTIEYAGTFVDGKYHGQGSITYKTENTIYIGFFQNGMKHGTGTLLVSSSLTYRGMWYEDKRHGMGTSYKAGVKRFEGIWENDKICGNGTTYYNIDEPLYVGKHVDNMVIGSAYNLTLKIEYKGTFKVSETGISGILELYKQDDLTIIYKGEIKDWLKHGYGITYNTDGSILYQGEFANNKMNGTGTYLWKNKNEYYVGNMVNDFFDGMGKLYNKTTKKLIYEGMFKSDKLHGPGKKYDSDDNLIADGIWECDVLISKNDKVGDINNEILAQFKTISL